MSIKKVLRKYISEQVPREPIALFLSGGMDSQLLLAALIEEGREVSVYSFTRNDRESSDFKRAYFVARYFQLPFTKIELKMDDREYLLQQLHVLKYIYGAKKKTEFECCFPFLESAPLVKEPLVITGHGADQNFCIAKSAILHWRDKIEEYRDNAHNNPLQYHILQPIFKSFGKSLLPYPYQCKDMREWFRGKSWQECNSPKQKQLIVNEFNELSFPLEIEHHSNLQMGDSGIRDGFEEKLLEGTKFKNTIAIYNRI